jgi:hypothetical protein
VIIASEAVNVLSKKSYAGNIALKIDISKAFDTLDWNFLLAVLKQFGFGETFCTWIEAILHSAKLSVLVNGKLAGFFPCTRGVRQGDPLSPLLFCIAEDVLSRSISKASTEGKLTPMSLCRNVQVPTHVLYADDIMVFCKGSKRNIRNLMHIFHLYGEVSGQVINKQKSKFYSGAISNSRLLSITNLLGFGSGSIPFNYLGCPIFVGKPKTIHFRAITDKIKVKMASWKGVLLSIMGRVQLVRSIIHGMLVYSFHVYAWPQALLRQVDRWIRNFIWSGDINTNKLCTVAWRTVRRSYEEGSLNIRSLRKVNDSLMLQRCWQFYSSNEQWAVMCRARFLKWGQPTNTFLKSSFWHGIKHHVPTVKANTRWIIGSGTEISFWLDNWLSEPLVDVLNLPISAYPSLTARLSSFIVNGEWNIPTSIVQRDSEIRARIDNVVIP